MKTSLLFRFRVLITFVIIVLSVTAPWEQFLFGRRYSAVWVQLPLFLSQRFLITFRACSSILTTLLILLALAAALLRTWASAYLGARAVADPQIHSRSLVTAGPFRYVRHPLYIGVLLHLLALAVLMPPSGAVFAVVAVTVVCVRLAREEEARLLQHLGPAYAAYRARVPAWLPALRARIAPSAERPRWLQASLGECYMWGAFFTFALLASRYNPQLLLRGLLISLGLSIILRAFVAQTPDR